MHSINSSRMEIECEWTGPVPVWCDAVQCGVPNMIVIVASDNGWICPQAVHSIFIDIVALYHAIC